MSNVLIRPLLRKYRQGEAVQYLKRLFDILPEATANDLNIHAEWQALHAVYSDLFAKWQPERSSSITAVIARLDKARGKRFRSFKQTVDAWAADHYEPQIQAAAKIVARNLAAHGKYIYKMNYEQESAVLDAIINDCEGIHAAHITTMGLEDWVDALKNLNNAFGEQYLLRLEDYFAAEPGIVAELINSAVEAYQALSGVFEARWRIALADNNPMLPQYNDAGDLWNILTHEFNFIILRRYGKIPAKDTEADDFSEDDLLPEWETPPEV